MIRHPALVFESWYIAESRVGPVDLLDKSWSVHTTFRYTRQVFDWFLSKSRDCTNERQEFSTICHYAKQIIIDADDVIEENCLQRLCVMCGMQPDHINYEWEATQPPSTSTHSDRHLSYMEGLWSSTFIIKSKTSQGLDMAVKHDQWKEKFGVAVANMLYTLVENALADYNYLNDRKI
jgi:hypothetical protein